MLQYNDFNHKGVLIQIDDVPDALTDIRTNTPFEWQGTADDRFVFVCIERKIVEVFDTTGKLADNDIRTAYIGKEVDEEFYNLYPILRYMDRVEFDPNDENAISEFDWRAGVATRLLEMAQSIANDEHRTLGDISSGILDYVSDNLSGDSGECLESTIDALIWDMEFYDDFFGIVDSAGRAYHEHTSDYFAPYRIEWYMDEIAESDPDLGETLQEAIDDGHFGRVQEHYETFLSWFAIYSARLMLERGAFVLLEYGDEMRINDSYLTDAIDKFLQTTTEEYINEHQAGAVNQLNALKEYFGEAEDFEWIKEVPSDHTEFIPTLKRLSAALGNDYQVSPIEEFEHKVKMWADNPSNTSY